MYIQNKSIPMVIILSIVTCGIYYLIWMYQTSEEVNNTLGDTRDGPGLEVLLTIVTCGIYGLYWLYKYNQKLVRLGNNMGVSLSDNSIICLVLAIFGLTVVALGIIQSQINELADKGAGGPSNPNGYYTQGAPKAPEEPTPPDAPSAE